MSRTQPMLSRRELVGEIMDDPTLPESEHLQALRGLRRINALSRTPQTIFKQLLKCLGKDPDHPKRIIDVACGDGDNTLHLARLVARHGLPWQVSGCDISNRSIIFARELAAQRGMKIQFFAADALNDLETQAYDAVISSLFLHHLENERIVLLLRQLMRARHVVISDLVRGKLAYKMTRIGVQLLSRSRVVHTDGPLSVRAALTLPELSGLAAEAEMDGVVIRPSWPLRQLLVWSRP